MEKLRVFKVTAFPDITKPAFANTQPKEIYVPADAVSHLTLIDKGNARSGYNVHIKTDHKIDVGFPIKSINSGRIPVDLVEVLFV